MIKLKRLIAAITFIALCLSMSLIGYASNATIIASGTGSSYWETINWTLDTNGTVVLSPGNSIGAFLPTDVWGDSSDIVGDPIDEPKGIRNRDEITSVIIEEGIEFINDYGFTCCPNLKNVTIPNSVAYISHGAFRNCTGLTSIYLPKNVEGISFTAFEGCVNLVDITVDPENRYLTSRDGMLISLHETNGDEGQMLVYCPEGKGSNVRFPDGVTSVCVMNSKLKEIVLPPSVTLIDDYAFDGCTSLSTIKFEGNAPTFAEYAFLDSPGDGLTLTVYYPANNSTWTDKVRQNYCGHITWVAY